jgi:hypothetical protein
MNIDAVIDALILSYATGAAILTARTWQYYKNRQWPGIFDLFRPELYSAEGWRRRRALFRFCAYGAVALVAILVITNWLYPIH